MTATCFDFTTIDSTMLIGMELSSDQWKLAFSATSVSRVRIRNIAAGDLGALEREIALAKVKFRLLEDAPVQACYEAGRDGHWIHRALLSAGINNLVIESSCFEVDRRQKQRKNDRLDALVRRFARVSDRWPAPTKATQARHPFKPPSRNPGD